MSVFSGGTQVSQFGANTVLTGGTITLQGTADTTGDDRLVIGSANLTMYAADAAVLDIVDGKIKGIVDDTHIPTLDIKILYIYTGSARLTVFIYSINCLSVEIRCERDVHGIRKLNLTASAFLSPPQA